MRVALINDFDGKMHTLTVEHGEKAFTIIQTTDLEKFNSIRALLENKLNNGTLEEWITEYKKDHIGFNREIEE